MSGSQKFIVSGSARKIQSFPANGSKRAFAIVSIPTSEKYKDSNGQKVEKTEWHNVKFFNGLADTVINHLKENQMISVEAKLKTKNIGTDEDPNYVTDIVADSFNWL